MPKEKDGEVILDLQTRWISTKERRIEVGAQVEDTGIDTITIDLIGTRGKEVAMLMAGIEAPESIKEVGINAIPLHR